MTSPARRLRLLIETGDAPSPEARRLAAEIGQMLPEGAGRDRLMDELQDALHLMEIAEIAGVADPGCRACRRAGGAGRYRAAATSLTAGRRLSAHLNTQKINAM